MKTLISYFLLFLILPTFAQEKHMDLVKAIDEIGHKYIPDKRVTAFYFDVKDEGNKTIISGGTTVPALKEEIENKFKGSAYQVNFQLLPGAELSSKIYGVVNLSVANLRTKPGESSEMATQGLLGQPLKVFQKKGGWLFVQTPDNYTAWIDDDGLAPMDEKEMMAWKSSNKVIFSGNFGYSYSEPNKNSTPVSDLVAGDILKKLSVEGKYVKVEYPDKRTAYILSDEVEDFDKWSSKIKPEEDKIIAKALSFMGTPYLWGGTSAKAMDCSGFTKTVYFLNGLILQRDASQQYYSGDDIDISKGFQNLQPGDLLFFGNKGNGKTKERATHVAIYLGNGDYVHSSGRVRINSLDKTKSNFLEYRLQSLLKAKRIIGAKDMTGISPVKDLFNINGIQP